jgi:hypothetical protein|tara:strand:- start:120 stop:410 length:291 start_codon:yes stop_codon:yes gene_type:complete
MPEASSKKALFKIVGLAIAIIGLGLVLLAFLSETQKWEGAVPGLRDEIATVRGETDFQRYLIGGFGIILGYIGYRAYKYVPPSERERDYVSEEDLD